MQPWAAQPAGYQNKYENQVCYGKAKILIGALTWLTVMITK